jgi:hypothetical protein
MLPADNEPRQIAQSVNKRSATRYFAKAVVLKFRDLGWWDQKLAA